MKIKSIIISNFKSYPVSGVTIPFSSITGFIGPNSAGKTNILEALDLFFHPRKLDSSTYFHKENIDCPIAITVTFCEHVLPQGVGLAEKLLCHDGTLSLQQLYFWNAEKACAEPKKEKVPCALWQFTGSDSILNPMEKHSATDIKRFLKDSASDVFRTETGLAQDSAAAVFTQALTEYWCKQDTASALWQAYFTWCDSPASIPDKMQKELSTIALPVYLYLPIQCSVDDELSLKRGTHMEELFSYLLSATDTQKAKQQKAMTRIENQIERYYRVFYDKRLVGINKNLNAPSTAQWNFSAATLTLERTSQPIANNLQPTWHLLADDGFSSDISTKGNGMQRLAVFQLLQSYVDYHRKISRNKNIIIAIEEPELYLHPPYKRALYNMFRSLSGQFQICYTTHDPVFVNLEYFDEIVLVRKNQKQESFVKHVGWSLFENNALWKELFGKKTSQESKRDALKNKCSGEQNEGFFADKIILVEGMTEMYALPIYFAKKNFYLDRSNISLIRANGVTAMRAMYAIFNAFGIPVYVIFDGDKPRGEKFKLFQNLQRHTDLQRSYLSFVNALQDYRDEKNNIQLENLRTKMKSCASILPAIVTTYLGEDTLAIKQAAYLLQEVLLNDTQLKECHIQNNRDCKLQQELGMQTPPGYYQTIINSRFTMWEYEFEDSFSKLMPDYDQLVRDLKSLCEESKPLLAKMIASRVNPASYPKALSDTLDQIIACIQTLSTAQPIQTVVPSAQSCKSKSTPIPLRLYTPDNEPGQLDKIPVYVCAGGPTNPLADDPIYYAEGAVPPNTKFLVRITGQSMEPAIPDGSLVAVEKTQESAPDKSYSVFCLNGNSICKQIIIGKGGLVRLISRNKEVAPILIREGDTLIYHGTVICDNAHKPLLFSPLAP